MPQDRGIIQLLIILVLAVVIISLLGVKLGEVFQNKVLQDNFSFVFRAAKFVWENYLQRPARIIVQTFAQLIWRPFVDTLEGLKRGVNPFQDIGPQTPSSCPAKTGFLFFERVEALMGFLGVFVGGVDVARGGVQGFMA